MYYVIGLGNPGEVYAHTPHNIGKELIDELLALSGQSASVLSKDYAGNRGASIYIKEEELYLVKLESFMNVSGKSLTPYDISNPELVIVIHDDIDLPFGAIKMSKNKGSGGHNGIKSIEQSLKTRSFIRFRVGVCPTDWFGRPRKPARGEALNRYLTSKKLSNKYLKQYPGIAQKINKLIHMVVQEGYSQAVSKQGEV